MVTVSLILLLVVLVAVFGAMCYVSAKNPLWYIYYIITGSFELMAKLICLTVQGIFEAISGSN